MKKYLMDLVTADIYMLERACAVNKYPGAKRQLKNAKAMLEKLREMSFTKSRLVEPKGARKSAKRDSIKADILLGLSDTDIMKKHTLLSSELAEIKSKQ